MIPDISKWKFNDKIAIKYIFKGCNSLLLFPDISKWNIYLTESFNSSSSSNISIKTGKRDSELSKSFIESSSKSENLSSLKDNNEIESPENNNDFYENFYII